MIKLNPDALDLMKRTSANSKLLPFSIVFVKADRARDSGGEVVSLDKAYLSSAKRSGSLSSRTINIRPVGTQDFVKVHLDLILYLNDMPIA